MKEYILIKKDEKIYVVIDKSKATKEDVSPIIGRFVFDGYEVETVGKEEYWKIVNSNK